VQKVVQLLSAGVIFRFYLHGELQEVFYIGDTVQKQLVIDCGTPGSVVA